MLYNTIHIRLTVDRVKRWLDGSEDVCFIVNCLTPVFEAERRERHGALFQTLVHRHEGLERDKSGS